MLELTFLLFAVAAAGVILGSFVLLERSDRHEAVVGVVVGVLIVEALLYGTQNNVPRGLLHPALGGFQVRPPDILIPLALLARVLVFGLPRRTTVTGLAWAAFLTWYAFAGVLGWIEGNPFDEIVFQSKVVLYLGGGMALASGVRAARLVRPEVVAAGIGALLATALPLAALTPSGLVFEVDLPGLRIERLGSYGADASSLVVSVAAIALLLEGCRPRRRWWVAAACVVLLLTPLAGSQSGSLLQLLAVSAVLLVASLGPTWRRRMEARGGEALLLVVALGAAALVGVLVPVSHNAELPLAANIEESFVAEPHGASFKTRQLLYGESRVLIEERPVAGWGLGAQITLRRVSGFNVEEPAELTAHNLVLDLLLRTGAIGLALFAVAIGLSLKDAMRTWVAHADGLVAALALGCAVAVTGLLTKGMVESVTEKFRLCTALGLLVGVIASTRRVETARPPELEDDGTRAPPPLAIR